MEINVSNVHCAKSVRIWSYSGPYFPAFGLNKERYSVSNRIQSKCGKVRTRITPNTDTSYAVDLFALSSYLFKIWTRSSYRMWKTRLQTFCIAFKNQFGIIIPKIQNLFRFPDYPFTIFLYYMHLFSMQ